MRFTLLHSRTVVQLGQELGRGGEGAVFPVAGRTDQVAKVYLSPPDPRKLQKLSAMAEGASPELLQIAAWPVDLLVDGKGSLRGFLMPRIKARRDVHELYSPKSRSEAFPESDFRFLVHVAANLTRAFAVVHENGHVLGDVNHGNALVGPDGTVTLIDCDSFQIRNGAQTFTCDVGVPLFTPPELHGRSFRGLLRSANHDRFGLAVLLFHLLFMGRHPFAGRFTGPGDMPIERAIAEHRFAYGPDRSQHRMERPPGTVPLETMGPTVARLFLRAFGPDASQGGRPDERAWIQALERLKSTLRECPQASWHHYPRELASCPWCAVEAQTGVRLFGQRVAVGPTGAVDLATLWQAIAAVPAPPADPALPPERTWSPPAGVKLPSAGLKWARQLLSGLLLFGGLAACNTVGGGGALLPLLLAGGLAYVVWPHVSPAERAEADRAAAAAWSQWEAALNAWRREASTVAFASALEKLEKARNELADLTNERRRRLARLEARRERDQRLRYLDRFRIDRAKIRGIGPGRTAMLASYGIETAADVDGPKIERIPGFGEVLTSELTEWRYRHERNFRFNPAEPVDPREIAALDRELAARRSALLQQLQQGPAALHRLRQEIAAARPRLMPVLEGTWTDWKIAEARRKAL